MTSSNTLWEVGTTMKKADLTTVIKLVRENKCSQLEIIHLMYTLQRAIVAPDLTPTELYKYFKERTEQK